MNRLLVLLISITTIWVIVSCSESKLIQPNEPMFEVSGKLYAGYCPFGWGGWFPYTESLGLPGTITLTDTATGTEFTTMTNSVSDFSARVPEGDYFLEVYIPHSYPFVRDTLSISKDTTYDIQTVIAWLWHDTIIIDFTYETGDTLSADSERVFIDILDSAVGGILDLNNMSRRSDRPYGVVVWNEYRVPFNFVEYPPWQLSNDLNNILESDSTIFPGVIDIHLNTFLCYYTDSDPEDNEEPVALE